jgi:hypothetical protein
VGTKGAKNTSEVKSNIVPTLQANIQQEAADVQGELRKAIQFHIGLWLLFQSRQGRGYGFNHGNQHLFQFIFWHRKCSQ